MKRVVLILPSLNLLCWVAVVVAGLMFLMLAYTVQLENGPEWDTHLMRTIHEYHTPVLNTTMQWITRTGSLFAMGLAVMVAILLWREGYEPEALTFLASMGGLEIGSIVMKHLFERARPDVFLPLTPAHGYSFPSGHTTSASAFYGLLAVWLWRIQHRGWAMVAGLWVIAIGVSRVYLGVHYPSDVLAGLLLGVIWISAIMHIYDRYSPQSA